MAYSGGVPSGSKDANDPLWTGSFTSDPGANVFPADVFPPASASSEYSIFSSDGPTITKNIFVQHNVTKTVDQIPFGFAGGVNTIRARPSSNAYAQHSSDKEKTFLSGVSGDPIPLTIAGCNLWLDADDASSFTLSGSDIEEWRNKSTDYAGVFDYKQTSGAVRPDYVTSALNSKSIVRFNGIWDYMSSSGDVSKRSPAGTDQTMTAFFVAREHASSTGQEAILQWGLKSDNGFSGVGDSTWFHNGDGLWSGKYMFFSNEDMSKIIYTDANGKMETTAQIFAITQTTSNITFHVTGTLNATAATPHDKVYPANNANIYSLLGRDYASDWFHGDIAEIIVYNRDLSASERGTIESYLSTKWGVAIS